MDSRLNNLGDKLWGPMVEVVKPIPVSVRGDGDGFTAKVDDVDGKFEVKGKDQFVAIEELCEYLAELFYNLFKHKRIGMSLNPSQEQKLNALSQHLRVRDDYLPKTKPSEAQISTAN